MTSRTVVVCRTICDVSLGCVAQIRQRAHVLGSRGDLLLCRYLIVDVLLVDDVLLVGDVNLRSGVSNLFALAAFPSSPDDLANRSVVLFVLQDGRHFDGRNGKSTIADEPIILGGFLSDGVLARCDRVVVHLVCGSQDVRVVSESEMRLRALLTRYVIHDVLLHGRNRFECGRVGRCRFHFAFIQLQLVLVLLDLSAFHLGHDLLRPSLSFEFAGDLQIVLRPLNNRLLSRTELLFRR